MTIPAGTQPLAHGQQMAGSGGGGGGNAGKGGASQAVKTKPSHGAQPGGPTNVHQMPEQKAPTAAGKPPGTSPQTQSALDFLKQTLQSWGLETLYGKAVQFLQNGTAQTPAELQLEFENTQEWKTRFAGNEIRKANGLAELSPAQYLSLEASYRQVMQAYGLPKGFYDQHHDLADFIGKDVSPAELQARAQIAHDQYMNAPGYIKDLWGQYFGTKGDAIAAILDPKIATQTIQDRAAAVQVGGAGAKYGIGVGYGRANQLAKAGVTAANADKGFQQISQSQDVMSQIAQRFGTTFDLNQAEDAALLGKAGALNKVQTLQDEEQGLFKQHSGADQSTLSANQTY